MAKKRVSSDPHPIHSAVDIRSEDGLVAVGNGKIVPDVTHLYALPGEGMRRFTLKQAPDGLPYLIELLDDGTEEIALVGKGDFDAFVAAHGAWAE